MLAAASGEDVPARADDRYIVKTFNRFAASFDEKLQRLEYCAPQLVAASLIHHPLYQTGGLLFSMRDAAQACVVRCSNPRRGGWWGWICPEDARAGRRQGCI